MKVKRRALGAPRAARTPAHRPNRRHAWPRAHALFRALDVEVEQSMISAPLAMAGTTSVPDPSTCLPAGSMVITTSAPFTEPTALSRSQHHPPGLIARGSDETNATSLWPPLTRLAAMGPPILPRPMNAIVAMSKSSAGPFLLIYGNFNSSAPISAK